MSHSNKLNGLEIACFIPADEIRCFDAIRGLIALKDRIDTMQSTFQTDVCFHADAVSLESAIRKLNAPHTTCDLCCHYQAHPPRCQLSKHSISPKQFSCKKYSPKHIFRK